MVEVLREGEPRARKQHRCDSCMGTIEPGEVYYRQTIADGDLRTFKCHTRCARASNAVVDANPSVYPYYEDMPVVSLFEREDWETIKEAAPDLYAEFMARTNGYGPEQEGK